MHKKYFYRTIRFMASPHEWITAAGFAGRLSKRLHRSVSLQLLRAYVVGIAFPPADVIQAVKIMTHGEVTKADWLELAKARGKTTVASESGRPRRPRKKETRPRAPRKPKT